MNMCYYKLSGVYLFFFIIPFLIFCQNDCSSVCYQEIDKRLWTEAHYKGCVDKFGTPSGKGKQEFDNKEQIYDGCWEKGRKHGYGKLIRKEWRYEGNWEKGQRDGYGELYVLNPNQTWNYVYKGNWKDNQKHGNGEEWTITNQDTLKWVGEWDSDMKITGNYHYENTYSANDIISNKEVINITLERNPQNDHCYIDLTFDNITESFMYDTGASTILLNPRLLNKLQNSNIQIEPIGYSKVHQTASGTLKVDYYSVEKISIGNILTIKNVIIGVGQEDCSLLLGTSFVDKFRDDVFSVKKCQLTLWK